MKIFNILKARELSEKGFDEYVEKEAEAINIKIEAAAKSGKFYLVIDGLISEPVVKALKKEGYSVEERFDEWEGHFYLVSWEKEKERKRWGK